MIRSTTSALATWFFLIACSAAAETPRWAIVADDTSAARSLADLTTVELTQWEDVHLVERDAIDRVLAELKLGAAGLIADDRAVELGRLASADVVIPIESLDKLTPPQTRMRAIEVRTGVRLLDTLIPAASLEADVAALRRELRLAKDKWLLPQGDRRYVAVLGVQNEEPGDALTPQAAALTALVEHDLRRAPGVLVLEREQLQRLRLEQQLTGVELELRSAAVLVEAGLRRDDSGQGFAVTLRLVSMTGAPAKGERFVVPQSDLQSVRHELVQQCERLLNLAAAPEAPEPEELAREAEIFARRSYWLQWNDRPEEAIALAEAALGLHPVYEHYRQAFQSYDRLWRRDSFRLNVAVTRLRDPMERRQTQLELLGGLLRAARRMHQLDLAQLRLSRESTFGAQSMGVNADPFHPHTPRVWEDPEPPELQRLREEVDALRLEKFRLLHAKWKAPGPSSHERLVRARRLLLLLVQRLERSHYFAASPEELCRQTLDWQKELDAEFAREARRIEEAGEQSNFPNRPAMLEGLHGQNVAALLRQRCLVGDLSSADDEPRAWSAEQLAPLWSELTRHERPAVQAVGFAGLADLPGEDGMAAAESLWDLLEEIPVEEGLPDELERLAVQRLGDPGKLAALIEQRLRDAEQSQRPRLFWTRRPRLTTMLSQAPLDQRAILARRAIQLIDREKPADQADALTIARQRDALIRTFVAVNVPMPADLLPPAPGLWAQYQTKPLPLKLPAEVAREQLLGVLVDTETKTEGREPQLLVFVRSGVNNLWIGRAALSGGEVQQITQVPYESRGQYFGRPVMAAAADGMIFVNTGAPGLAVVRPDNVRIYGEADGFPGNRLVDMVWFDGELYLSVFNGLARFDPQKETFKVLTSSLALDGPGPLDGGVSYQIIDLLADPGRGAIWLAVQGDAARYGIWKYTPATNEWARVYAAQPNSYLSPLWRAGDQIRFVADFGWREIRADTGVAASLVGYHSFQRGNTALFSTRYAQSGDHVIGFMGHLFAPNGEVWKYPLRSPMWWSISPMPGGFLAHDSRDGLILFQHRTKP